ncbi:MAG TPA: M23 family metallopeptidase [Anaeromyxobacteraceae bacterium]|nr:M23 family metallopeptidase [Anaeromyxobacteraceae bacterium]
MAPSQETRHRPFRGLLLLALTGLTVLLAISLLDASGRLRAKAAEREVRAPVAVPSTELPALREPAPLRTCILTRRLGPNQSMEQVLARLGLAPEQIQAILRALGKKLPFHRAKPGDQLQLERVEGEKSFRRFTYRQNARDEWTVVPGVGGELLSSKRTPSVATEIARMEVEIGDSLWEGLQKEGEEPGLADAIADVLAWDVDLYRDGRSGDRLRALVEKIYVDGQFSRYGKVLGVEYDGAITGRRRLFRYTNPTGFTSYYDDNGNSAQRGFLKSPLMYAHRATSPFGNRLHPLLGYVRAHQGVDYGAPTGTPVWSVSNGTVEHAGWRGGCGKSVTIRHPNDFETIYCHLSAISVRAGARVEQKQVIGLVGQTGFATGPHLHFAVKHRGAFVNPASLTVPLEASVAPEHRDDFNRKTAPLRARLDARPIA